jgi:hypothetical protein
LDGPTETIAASIPMVLAQAIRERTGKRGFSRFVTEALHRAVVRQNLQNLVDDLVAEAGPLDPGELREIDELMR